MTGSGHEAADFLAHALQYGIGLVFLLAAIPKLRQPVAFTATMRSYELVPERVSTPLAYAVIAVESILAVLFLTGWYLGAALGLGALVVLAFLCGVALNLRRGRSVPCGCFGNQEERISGRSVARLTLMLGVIVALTADAYRGGTDALTLSAMADGGVELAYVVQVAGFALFLLVVCAWILSFQELRSMVAPRRKEPLDADVVTVTSRGGAR